MSGRDVWYAEHDDSMRHRWRAQDIIPSFPFQQRLFADYLAVIWACSVALLLSWLIYSFSPNELLSLILGLGVRMASRISVGVSRLRGGRKSDGGALKTVFGIDSGSLRSISPTGTAGTTLRGFGSMLKSGGKGIHRPPGLGNMSNSCYQNSIIQGLASLRTLPKFLLDTKSQRQTAQSTNGALLDTLDKLNDPTSNGRHIWLPDKLKSMSTWQQQDAQEYYSKILDQLDLEAAQSLQKASVVSYGLKDALQTPPANIARDKSISKSDSLHNPLEGMLAQRVGCTSCGYSEGLSLIPFNCLTVPLGTNHLYDIRDCLDEYTKLEQIEGVECPKCTLLRAQRQLELMVGKEDLPEVLLNNIRGRLRHVEEALQNDDFTDSTIIKKCQVPKKQWTSSTKSKQAVIARPPRSLAIHVNRSLFNEFTGAQTKNNAHVEFPLGFDLGSWCLGSRTREVEDNKDEAMEDWSMKPAESMLPSEEEELPGNPYQYELRAVVTHSGRHENGHYICYRKRLRPGSEDGDGGNEDKAVDAEAWWRLSDEDVSPASQDMVLRQGGVFMLFYERIEILVGPTKSLATASSAASTTPASNKGETVLSIPIEAMEAAQIPLPDDGEDCLDDLPHQPNVALPTPPATPRSELDLFSHRSSPLETPSSEPGNESNLTTPKKTEMTSTVDPTSQLVPTLNTNVDSVVTETYIPSPAQSFTSLNTDKDFADDSSVTSFHGDSFDGSSVADSRQDDADDSSVASFHDEEAEDPGLIGKLKQNIPMRTSGLGSRESPNIEDRLMGNPGLRMLST